jgi:hypothetical protein
VKLIQYVCDVRGCDARASVVPKSTPEGWGELQIAAAFTGSGLRGARHVVLCPDHFQMFTANLVSEAGAIS